MSLLDELNSLRGVYFLLVGGDGIFGLGIPEPFILNPNPEDINYNHPTRISVVQTFGGAYLDDFGEGVTELSISGTTGHHNPNSLLKLNGEALLIGLRDMLLKDFHKDRQKKADAGQDPNDVKLFMLDALNDLMCNVYPITAQIRRNKQRPLLFQYHLRFAVLEKWDISDAFSAITDALF